MADTRVSIAAAARFAHDHLLWFLVGTYTLAALWPGPGLRLRDAFLGTVTLAGQKVQLSPLAVLLAFLLFNAGLGVRLDRAKGVLRRPLLLGTGLVTNIALPVVVTSALALGVAWWPDTEEYRNLLVGLALIAAMPIAGSSAAWSQHTDGDLALSLGLILGSTLLSPVTTPAVLRAVGTIASGDQAQHLRELASGGACLFLALCVALPSLLGMLLRGVIGGNRVDSAKQPLALAGSAALLLLCYANAAVSLPQAVVSPDLDYLALILVTTSGLCVAGFAAGWWVARRLQADRSQRTALMFGLGMTNNGTGLVLAATVLADHPQVMLPILFYNLIQHLTAGAVNAARKPFD
jgi:bile acid:Na+ symporter, BASS family